MNKKYMFHKAQGYKRGTYENLGIIDFQNFCPKDCRIKVGKGKCLKCEFNFGISEDENGKYVNCNWSK